MQPIDETITYLNELSYMISQNDEIGDDESRKNADNSEQPSNSDHETEIFESELRSDLILQEQEEENECMEQED